MAAAMLGNADLVELTLQRRELHRHPDLSRDESATADRVAGWLADLGPDLGPDLVIRGLGGAGLAAVFDSGRPGPTVLFRAELDGLPIQEIASHDHPSLTAGKGHLCGHDGHMTFLLALGRLLARQRPGQGRAVLMFQPAEEDGSGAAAVTADPKFAAIRPDFAFAIHNMPGLPFGTAAICAGTVNCASVGMSVTLTGKTAHASQPEAGVSPALALAELIPALGQLGTGGAMNADFRLVTITHANMGAAAFGIAPADARLFATLRTLSDAPMRDLKSRAVDLVTRTAQAHGLALTIDWQDDFAASVNDPRATDIAVSALNALGIVQTNGELPFRASEDFGRFGAAPTRSAMVFLGAGVCHANLHNPDYDFPDDLIAVGTAIFHRIARDLLF